MTDKQYKNVLIEREDGITFLMLNRPDKRNAMSPELHYDMDDALDWGIARWPGFSRLFSAPLFRHWFYYRARRATAGRFIRLAKPGQIIIAIGDAIRPGKSKEAIASAFEAALLPEPRSLGLSPVSQRSAAAPSGPVNA